MVWLPITPESSVANHTLQTLYFAVLGNLAWKHHIWAQFITDSYLLLLLYQVLLRLGRSIHWYFSLR